MLKKSFDYKFFKFLKIKRFKFQKINKIFGDSKFASTKKVTIEILTLIGIKITFPQNKNNIRAERGGTVMMKTSKQIKLLTFSVNVSEINNKELQ